MPHWDADMDEYLRRSSAGRSRMDIVSSLLFSLDFLTIEHIMDNGFSKRWLRYKVGYKYILSVCITNNIFYEPLVAFYEYLIWRC